MVQVAVLPRPVWPVTPVRSTSSSSSACVRSWARSPVLQAAPVSSLWQAAFVGAIGRRRFRRPISARAASSLQVFDPWSVLGVQRGAERDEVRKAFRDQIRDVHPDVGGDPERFRVVNLAYDKVMATIEGSASSESSRRPDSVTGNEGLQKRSKTLEDFLDWRDEQQPVRDARRREVERLRAERRRFEA
ncbi:unnamed protein product, partial [Polarella glacialis]